jgi:hypothetical protein
MSVFKSPEHSTWISSVTMKTVLENIVNKVKSADVTGSTNFICLSLFSFSILEDGPPLWSSGQSSWLRIRRPRFDSRHYKKKK